MSKRLVRGRPVDPENKVHLTMINMGAADLSARRRFGHSMAPNWAYVYGWRRGLNELRAEVREAYGYNVRLRDGQKPINTKSLNHAILRGQETWKNWS